MQPVSDLLSVDGVDEPGATHLQQALPHVKKQWVL